MTRFDDTPVTSQADLERLWTDLMSPLGFGSRSVWALHLLADGRPVKNLIHIVDTDTVPAPDERGGLGLALREVEQDLPGEPGRWAFLMSRPGSGSPTPFDRDLAAALVLGCREAGVATDVVHLAHDHGVVPVPLDELPVDVVRRSA